jgi:hypothetical protein
MFCSETRLDYHLVGGEDASDWIILFFRVWDEKRYNSLIDCMYIQAVTNGSESGSNSSNRDR